MSEQLSFDVFLSYSSKDTTAVRSFAEGLRAAGLRVWYDEWEIQPGDSIPAKIEEGLERSRILALFMSANAFGSDWSRLESYTFRFRDPLNKERRFIPLRLDAAPIPGSLAQFSYVDCRSDEREKSYATLLARCSPSNVPASTGGATTTVSIGESLKPVSKPSDPHDLSRETNAKVRNTLTIIVPIYNESRAIRDLIKGLKAEGLIGRYRIILCDDGSTDGSFDLIEQYCKGLDNVDCIKNRFNLRKVGAIDRMTRMVHTPFVLTLDADCVLSELQDGALEDLMHTMSGKGYAATCFRILPLGENWLDRLQKLDYLIFTDSLRKILGVPVCLIGQGVLWKTDSFLKVLEMHSGQFHGDDLENTIIALHYKFAIYWERKTIVLMTKPKKTILGLVRQRALSWDFGMYRVLLGKRALQLGGSSGAFYKNILLMDFVAHPFKLFALPMLLSIVLLRIIGQDLYESALYRQSIAISLKYGSIAIGAIWIMSVLNSFVCVRGRIIVTVKWAIVNAVYLASPFVYLMYYQLVKMRYLNAYDVLGSSVFWLGAGLLLTYFWWALVTLCLLSVSSVEWRAKLELLLSVLLAPIYYFVLLVVCKTLGIIKYVKELTLASGPR